ncbi:hypothetical protein E3169_03730 [Escherichia coli O157:H7]|nr:hypothetical protein E3169_03730 [Escherichia coli O157:H7]
MLPSETMIWQPEFTDKTLSRKTGAVHKAFYQLCCHMEPQYHQLEFDTRLWLTQLSLGQDKI